MEKLQYLYLDDGEGYDLEGVEWEEGCGVGWDKKDDKGPWYKGWMMEGLTNISYLRLSSSGRGQLGEVRGCGPVVFEMTSHQMARSQGGHQAQLTSKNTK